MAMQMDPNSQALAEKYIIHKMICRNCYSRNPLRATVCRHCKCPDLRPKKITK